MLGDWIRAVDPVEVAKAPKSTMLEILALDDLAGLELPEDLLRDAPFVFLDRLGARAFDVVARAF